jgi:hypothetical protein
VSRSTRDITGAIVAVDLEGGGPETVAVPRCEVSDGWTFREGAKDQFHPARVPGCVPADLLRNQLIPDPYFGTNEQDLQRIDKLF